METLVNGVEQLVRILAPSPVRVSFKRQIVEPLWAAGSLMRNANSFYPLRFIEDYVSEVMSQCPCSHRSENKGGAARTLAIKTTDTQVPSLAATAQYSRLKVETRNLVPWAITMHTEVWEMPAWCIWEHISFQSPPDQRFHLDAVIIVIIRTWWLRIFIFCVVWSR